MLINDIIDIFGIDKNKLSIIEKFEYLEIVYKSTVVKVPKAQDIEYILNNIYPRDRIKFYVECDENRIAEYSNGDDINTFIDRFQDSVDDVDDINYVINIRVAKDIIEGNLSIYSTESFIDYLSKLSLNQLLCNLNKIIKKYNHIYFRTNDKIRMNTQAIYFLDEHDQIDDIYNTKSLNKEKRIINCSYLNESEYDFVAEDFIIVKKSGNDRLDNIFFKLAIMYSLIGICDVSMIGDNSITYIINGYHRIESKLSYASEFNENLDEYIKIYNWIYSDLSNSSCTDKIGIARNVISASVRENNLFCFNNGLFKSVCSAHSIYLKENVKQYLEVKSKVSEFNFDLMQKMSSLSKEIGKSAFNNMFIIASFYGTVFVMNTITDEKFENLFTRDITNFSILIWIVSIFYMLYNRYNVYQDEKIFEKQYERIKENYSEILNNDDIENIFKSDEYFNYDKKNIEKRSNIAVMIWSVLLILIFMIIYHLGYQYVWELIDGFILKASNILSNKQL